MDTERATVNAFPSESWINFQKFSTRKEGDTLQNASSILSNNEVHISCFLFSHHTILTALLVVKTEIFPDEIGYLVLWDLFKCFSYSLHLSSQLKLYLNEDNSERCIEFYKLHLTLNL